MHSKRKAEAAIELYIDVFLLNVIPMAMKVNITAERRTDADAPVTKENIHRPANNRIKRITLERFTKGIF